MREPFGTVSWALCRPCILERWLSNTSLYTPCYHDCTQDVYLLCAGTAVVVYGGELVSQEEAKRRRLLLKNTGSKSARYFLQISGSQQFVVDGYQVAKDISDTPDMNGEYHSNSKCSVHPGSMVNHSTRPNLKFGVIFLDSDPDRLMPGIPTLMALRDIVENEELFVNYGNRPSFNDAECKLPENQWIVDGIYVQKEVGRKRFQQVNVETSTALLFRRKIEGLCHLFPCEPSHGVWPFHLKNQQPLLTLERLLHANYHDPKPVKSKCIGLLASLGRSATNGYYGYHSSIAALAGKHDGHQQQIRTAQVQGAADITWLLNHPEIGSSVTEVLGQLLQMISLENGLSSYARCACVHFLAQDASSHAEFGLHVDNLEVKCLKNTVLTCVVQLSEAPTAMRMWLFKEGYVYSGRGAGCIFPGAAIHAGASTTPPPPVDYLAFKIVFFIQ